MRILKEVFERNRAWAESIKRTNPSFFRSLANQQSPKHLWIGCSDSRVPANQIMGMEPGEVFVHRNVANQVVHSDLNCLSVIQFAVEVLKVEHIIVCGHYGCGGVKAALEDERHGLVDNWLRHVQDVRDDHTEALAMLGPADRFKRLCELNVIEQVVNVCQTTIVEDAWSQSQPLAVHGWIYGLNDGLLRDLDMCVTGAGELDAQRRSAVAARTT